MILLYGAKDEKFNNAIALKEYLEEETRLMVCYGSCNYANWYRMCVFYHELKFSSFLWTICLVTLVRLYVLSSQSNVMGLKNIILATSLNDIKEETKIKYL